MASPSLFKDGRGSALTHAHDAATEALVAATKPGMAHWAGTGPSGKRCVNCRHFLCKKEERGTPMQPAATCAKYRMLMNRAGAKFGGFVAACRYFEAE